MNYYLTLFLVLFVYMSLWFVVSLVKKRNDVADVAWGLGFVLISWVSFLLANNNTLVSLTVSTIVTVWGLRLAWHIYNRNKGRLEDYRYAQWRKDWGKWFQLRSYLQVYLLQGLFLYLIVFPVLIINNSQSINFGFLELAGLLIWLIGFFFESVGDWQLIQFIKNPKNKGRLMTSGLWAYTRHPNYFGEVTQWWGIWLIALSAPFGIIAVIGPLTITFLILKVSGIPLLEKRMSQNPEFTEYSRRVSIFLPLPTRN